MRPPLLESPPEAARGPSVEVIILRLFPFIKVPAFGSVKLSVGDIVLLRSRS